MSIIMPDRFGIMTVDPGGTSGLASGVFRTDKGDDMLKTVIGRAVKKKQINSWQETGEPEEQSWAICYHWVGFRYRCNSEYGIPIPNIYFVMEDFQLRQEHADLYPVEIRGGVKALLCKKVGSRFLPNQETLWPLGKPVLQSPSTAMRITNDRLKQLGVYQKSSEHRRDALRHLVRKVDILLGSA